MPGFHEFDVALSPFTPAAGAASRTPTNEAHVNVWQAGTKGTPFGTLSDAVNIANNVGLILATSKQGTALANAPTELVLGDASGAWILNIADLNISSAQATLFSGVFLF